VNDIFEHNACPCGSGLAYGDCCRWLHLGKRQAATPVELMRSRYSAFVLRDARYLARSWHPATRPQRLNLQDMEDIHWTGLEIVSAPAVQAGDTRGTVEFRASCEQSGRREILHEISCFVRHKGKWLYFDGEASPELPGKSDIARNDPCACGSGRKYKRCCGRR
jgi:SEC-C motif-containing protein